jgi:hypothetical protein
VWAGAVVGVAALTVALAPAPVALARAAQKDKSVMVVEVLRRELSGHLAPLVSPPVTSDGKRLSTFYADSGGDVSGNGGGGFVAATTP